MSYTAKYSSSLYTPFREAISASSNLGSDKKNHIKWILVILMKL